MAKKRKDDTLVDLVEVTGQVENFWEKNQNNVLGVVALLAVLIGGYFAYFNLYQVPREKEAQESMYQAEFQFEKDSFALALTNPGGGFDGFLDIIENYSGTSSANISKYYAAVCYLHMGQFEEAADLIDGFSADGKVTPAMKYGIRGDIYAEQSDLSKASSQYKKAANSSDSDFLSSYYLKKYGESMEVQGNKSEALAAYEEIKSKYSTTADARNIDMYINRLK